MSIAKYITDRLTNIFTGLGTARDKTSWLTYNTDLLPKDQLDNAYRGDWIARKVVDIPAYDATREWRTWQADRVDISRIEAEERRLGLQRKVMTCLMRARLYGGSGLILGTADEGDDLMEPLNVGRIQKEGLKYVHVATRYEITAGPPILDLQNEWYGHPEYYDRNVGGSHIRLHPSRVVRFIGMEIPDIQMSQGWGDSILQTVSDAVKATGVVTASIATLVQENKIDVIRVPELTASLADPEYAERLKERFALAADMKSMFGLLLLDHSEEWQRINAAFTGLPDILRMYFLVASGAADIPATRMLGQSPAGLSATGESDIRNYYDRVSTEQKTAITPALHQLDEVLLRSALGNRPDEIFYEWEPLWQMTEAEKAEIAVKKANAFKIDVDSGVHDPVVLAEARQNQLIEDGTYPGLEQILEEHEEMGESGEEGLELPATSPTPEPGGIMGKPADAPVQNLAMNGGQITAMQGVIEAVAENQMPIETAKRLIMIGFPDVPESNIDKMLLPLESFERPEPDPAPNPFGDPPAPVPPGGPAEGDEGDDQAGDITDRLRSFDKRRRRSGTRGALRRTFARDAGPLRTLYVRRDVLNAEEIKQWARSQGFEVTVPAEEMHVTIALSRQPVDWFQMGEDWSGSEKMEIGPGGPRALAVFNGGATVLQIASSSLSWRHESMKERGATWDWPDYSPHITLTYESDLTQEQLDKLTPYRGKIILGPEIFEEVKEDWKGKIVEDSKWSLE